ncbi:hypothetical protein L7F22_002197 [Adiantum nelumboides]|nr:hypothetical protein [Adiantum nelumboides]
MIVLSSPPSTLLTKEPLSLHPNTELQPNSHGCHFKHSSVINATLITHVEQSFSRPVNSLNTYSREEGQANISAPSSIQSPTKAKVAKRVTFARDLVQIPPSNQPISHEEAAAVAPSASGNQEAHQYLTSMVLQREKHIIEELSASVQMKKAGAVPHNNILRKEEVISGVVRVKVVVSKKQLSELMSTALLSSTGVLRMQAADAFAQKTAVAPLLPQLIAASSPQHICGQKNNHNSRADLKDANVMRRILDDNDDDTSEEGGSFSDAELEYSSTSTDGSASESENSFLNAFELDINTDEIDTFSHSSIGLNLEIVLEIDHEDLYADITSVP